MALSRKTSSAKSDKTPATAWVNVVLISSTGTEYKLPVGIPLNSDNESAIVQALLTQGVNGQEFNGKLTLNFVGTVKSDNITL